MPDLAIVDYTNTKSSPKSITASTGLDALTHAVEAYTSKQAQPLTAAIPKMTSDALASGSHANTRKNVGAEDIAAIYRALI